MLGDVKTIKDMDRLAGFLRDDLKVRLPHVSADKEQPRRAFFPKGLEKLISVSMVRSFPTHNNRLQSLSI
jgi:hypothetical protein